MYGLSGSYELMPHYSIFLFPNSANHTGQHQMKLNIERLFDIMNFGKLNLIIKIETLKYFKKVSIWSKHFL